MPSNVFKKHNGRTKLSPQSSFPHSKMLHRRRGMNKQYCRQTKSRDTRGQFLFHKNQTKVKKQPISKNSKHWKLLNYMKCSKTHHLKLGSARGRNSLSKTWLKGPWPISWSSPMCPHPSKRQHTITRCISVTSPCTRYACKACADTFNPTFIWVKSY
jgi:hypothetical protein